MSEQITKGEDLAFPANQTINDCDGNFMATISHSGLTKREHFAIQILAGKLMVGESLQMYSENARFAVMQADALIKQLNKGKEGRYKREKI